MINLVQDVREQFIKMFRWKELQCVALNNDNNRPTMRSTEIERYGLKSKAVEVAM